MWVSQLECLLLRSMLVLDFNTCCWYSIYEYINMWTQGTDVLLQIKNRQKPMQMLIIFYILNMKNYMVLTSTANIFLFIRHMYICMVHYRSEYYKSNRNAICVFTWCVCVFCNTKCNVETYGSRCRCWWKSYRQFETCLWWSSKYNEVCVCAAVQNFTI